MRILGAILAGGQSRRFGRDKAQALFDGQPLIAHAAAALAPHVADIVIVGTDFAPYRRIDDRPGPGLGPLGGLAGALHAAAGYDRVLTAPCDAPILPPDALRALLDDGGPAMLRGLPVCGLWPSGLATMLDTYLQTTEDRSMRAWGRTCGARWLDTAPIANINTPADLATLDRCQAGGGRPDVAAFQPFDDKDRS